MLRAFYSHLINIVFVFIYPKLKNKYSEGLDERRGLPSSEKLKKLQNKRPLWVHAVSVGEVQAAISIIKSARDDSYDGPILLTTTTETGKAMALRVGNSLFDLHLYYPWDRAKYVSSSLDKINPWAFVTIETEIWPNMLWALKDRGIPAILANGRISTRTWRRLSNPLGKRIGRAFYNLFTELCLRDENDKKLLESIDLPAEKLHVTGDTKVDALLTRKESSKTDKLRKEIRADSAPIFIAGSTHQGEYEQLLAAFKSLREKVFDAKLIIVPRHPEKSSLPYDLFHNFYKTVRLSERDNIWDVMIADEIGVLYTLYSFSTAAFVGGSFVDKGGQNILEPVSWGVPVQYGPHMEDFNEASEELLSLGIATQVRTGEELGEVWKQIISDDDREKYRTISSGYFEKKAAAATKTWKILSSYKQ